ncbi:MAG TPA: very short patch repair endonuclease [Archangium sp.]|nr:very short patch repair endonuclease [Archangium sp.]
MATEKKRKTSSYEGLRPASKRASAAARGSSRKSGTRCELLLRKALWQRGWRYRVDASNLPGRPDIVFHRLKVAIFVDGDFWHGRSLDQRIAKLARGHNAPYWVAKIKANVERDQRNTRALEVAGWKVLRLWETDIKSDVDSIARQIAWMLEESQNSME